MSAPDADRIVHDARIGPDDTPHEAAAHLWAQVVANHDVDPEGPLGQLGMFDRVVLVLHDVLGLSPSTVAELLHTEEAAVTSARAAARVRAGLPLDDAATCGDWQAVRDAHAPGDPAVLVGLAAHTADCATCSGTVTEDQHRMHRRSLRRGVGATAQGATAAAAAVAAPAFGGTLAAAAAIVAAGVGVGALVGPVPEPPLPEPVVVDADPGLPSDEEPVDGWPAQQPVPTDTVPTDTEGLEGTTDSEDIPLDDSEQVDEPTGPATDTVDDVTDTLDETLDDVTDTVQDTVDDTTDTVDDTTDEVTDTVDDTTDEVTDTVDDTTGGTSDEATDTVDETTSDAGDAVDDLVEDTVDTLP